MRDFVSRACRFSAHRLARASERLGASRAEIEARRYHDCFVTVTRLLDFVKPRFLCDIGAHAGHWSRVLKLLHPETEGFTLFEPQARFREQLAALDLGNAEKTVYPCALGAAEGSMKIKGGTASASLLEASSEQHRYFPGTFDSGAAETIRVEVLDNLYARDGLSYPDLVKVDVQGFELDVLRGAEAVLARAKCLVIELSFRAFYEGQAPLWEVLRFLDEHGYVLVGRGFEWYSATEPKELLQLDGIFMNTAA